MACVVGRFSRIYDDLLKSRLVEAEYVENYVMAREKSLHSVLQYALIRAGIECGYVSIPEYKVRLKKPIDKLSLDPRFRQGPKKRRYQRYVTVDAAFFRQSTLAGVGEIYTLDEVHGCEESRNLSGPWVTPRHKLQGLVGNLALDFVVIVNVFPAKGLSRPLPWADARKRSIGGWRSEWVKLVSQLRANVRVYHIEVNESSATEI